MPSSFSGSRFKEAKKAAFAYRPSHLKEKILLFMEAFILHHQGIISGQYIELQTVLETNRQDPNLTLTIAQYYKNLAAIEGDLRLLEEVHTILSTIDGDFDPIATDILKLTISSVEECAEAKDLAKIRADFEKLL
tara:strand:+ start:10261 stop:10665 length:405 start_codon:yes stop_codon:yes gene_type:complete